MSGRILYIRTEHIFIKADTIILCYVKVIGTVKHQYMGVNHSKEIIVVTCTYIYEL